MKITIEIDDIKFPGKYSDQDLNDIIREYDKTFDRIESNCLAAGVSKTFTDGIGLTGVKSVQAMVEELANKLRSAQNSAKEVDEVIPLIMEMCERRGSLHHERREDGTTTTNGVAFMVTKLLLELDEYRRKAGG